MSALRALALVFLLAGCAAPDKRRSGFLEPRTVFVGQPLLVEEVEGSRFWKLQRPLIYKTKDGLLIESPTGFKTNFASTPRFIWWLYPPWSPQYGRATVTHDRLYEQHGRVNDKVRLTRRQSDLVMREAMADTGSGYFTRSTFYNFVRVFNPEWPEDRQK